MQKAQNFPVSMCQPLSKISKLSFKLRYSYGNKDLMVNFDFVLNFKSKIPSNSDRLFRKKNVKVEYWFLLEATLKITEIKTTKWDMAVGPFWQFSCHCWRRKEQVKNYQRLESSFSSREGPTETWKSVASSFFSTSAPAATKVSLWKIKTFSKLFFFAP